MKYEFPEINTIDDVLPAIEGRDEFVVADKGDYIVINYNVAFEDTFPPVKVAGGSAKMRAEREHINAMRRECRGLIFYPDGHIMSRPFHKFFNVGERDETQLRHIDLSNDHVVMEKMDGSMIRPIMVDGVLRLATKMGVTDTSIAAEAYINTLENKDELLELLANWFSCGMTPLFEFISPENRIVVEYSEPSLVLLAVRDNRTGNYYDVVTMKWPLGVVQHYGSIEGTLDEYIERQRSLQGREGDIIAVGNMRYKIKNDWYVRIHKVKDKIRFDRHILAAVLENEIDDVLPHLDQTDYDRVKQYEKDFHAAYTQKLTSIKEAANAAVNAAAGDRKRLATEVLPASEVPKSEWGFVFGYADGKDLNELLMNYVKANMGSNVKYDNLAKMLGLV